KVFYWLAVGISVLFGLSGIVSGLALMSLHPLGGLFWIIGSLIGVVIGVVFARIVAEFVLIMFRINEHLDPIRQRGQMGESACAPGAGQHEVVRCSPGPPFSWKRKQPGVPHLRCTAARPQRIFPAS